MLNGYTIDIFLQWYKDDDAESVEFFRYVPRETPPVIVYNLPGISVNVSSTRIRVVPFFFGGHV